MNIFKKSVTLLVLVSMFAFVMPVLPTQAATIMDGDLVKAAGSSAVYLIQGSEKRVFPHFNVYLSWGYPSNFSSVKSVSASDLAAYTDGNPVPFKPGNLFRGTAASLGGKEASAVFYVDESYKLRAVKSAEIYQALFKDASWSKVTWVPDDLLAKFAYEQGALVESSSVYPNGALLKSGGKYYLISDGKKREMSSAALTANKYKVSDSIAVDDVSGYAAGDAIVGAESAVVTPGWKKAAVAAAGSLMVSLAADSPAASTVPGQAKSIGLLKMKLTAGASDVSVNGMTFKNVAVGNTSDWSALYLYDGAKQLNSSGRTITSDSREVEFPTLSISIPAGSSKYIYLKGDLASTASASAIHSFQLKSISSAATVSGIPLSGSQITVGAVNIATVDITAGSSPSNPTVGQKGVEIATFKITAPSSGDASFERVVLTFSGSIARSAVTNLKLYKDGDLLASAATVESNDTVTLALTSPLSIPKGYARNFSVKADLGGRTGETLTTKIDETGHITVIDSQYSFGAKITLASGTAALTIGNALTLQGGKISVADNGPTASDIQQNSQDITLLNFSITADRAVEVKRYIMNFIVDTASIDGAKFSDLRLKDADSGATITSFSTIVATGTNYTASGNNEKESTDSFYLAAGTAKNLRITADIASNANAGAGIKVNFSVKDRDSTTVEIKDNATGDYINASDVVPRDSSDYSVYGELMTVRAASLTMTAASSPSGAQTVVKGSSNVEALGVVFAAGTASDIKITKIIAKVYASNAATFATSVDPLGVASAVKLYDDAGALIAEKSYSVSSNIGTATFDSLNVNVAKGASKKLVFKINTISNLTAERFAGISVDLDDVTAYDKDNNALSFSSNTPVNNTVYGTTAPTTYADVKTSGSLKAELAADTPESGIVIAGSSAVSVAKYKFTAQDEQFRVDDLTIKLETAGNEGSVVKVKASYTGGSKEGFLSTASGTSSVTLRDLGWVIAANGADYLTISADLKAIDYTQTESGRSIKLAIQEGSDKFKATGTSGGLVTDLSGVTNTLFGNEMFLRKSKPIFASTAYSGTALNEEKTLYSFGVSADSAGDVSFKQLTFETTVSGITVSSLKFYRGSLQLVAGTDINIRVSQQSGAVTGVATEITSDSDKKIIVSWLDGKEEIVAKGTQNVYTLKGLLAGVAAGDAISVRLAEELSGSDGTQSTYSWLDIASATVNGIGASSGTFKNIIWSDMAKGINHNSTDGSTSGSADWANGIKAKELPGAYYTYSKTS